MKWRIFFRENKESKWEMISSSRRYDEKAKALKSHTYFLNVSIYGEANVKVKLSK